MQKETRIEHLINIANVEYRAFGRSKDFKAYEKEVIDSKNPKWIIEFCKHVIGANQKKFAEIMISIAGADDLLEFGKIVDGVAYNKVYDVLSMCDMVKTIELQNSHTHTDSEEL